MVARVDAGAGCALDRARRGAALDDADGGRGEAGIAEAGGAVLDAAAGGAELDDAGAGGSDFGTVLEIVVITGCVQLPVML